MISILAIVLTIRVQNKSRINVNDTEDLGEPANAEKDLHNGAYAHFDLTNDSNYYNLEKQDFEYIDGTDGYVEMRINLN